MTQPADQNRTDDAPVLDGTDITADPQDLETDDHPATSDPEQLTDEGRLGGAGGAGGAG